MKLKASVIALTAVMLSASAFAGTQSFAPPLDPANNVNSSNATNVQVNAGDPNPVADFTFQLLSNGIVDGTLTISDISHVFTPVSYSLYSGTPSTGTFIASAVPVLNGNNWTASITQGLLASNSPYYYELIGSVSSGSVSVGVSLSSTVPEASTWAMMGIGFAGLAFAGYRTRRSSAAIA